MILTNKQLSFAYLNLCASITGKKKATVSVEFSRNGLDTYSLEDVEIYLRGRVDDIVEKKEEYIKEEIKSKEYIEIINKDSTLTPWQIKMAEIMKNIKDKPVDTILPPVNPTIVKGIYVPPTDRYGFFDE